MLNHIEPSRFRTFEIISISPYTNVDTPFGLSKHSFSGKSHVNSILPLLSGGVCRDQVPLARTVHLLNNFNLPTYNPLPVHTLDEGCSRLQSGGQPHLHLKHRLHPHSRARLPEQLQAKPCHIVVIRDDSPRRNLPVLPMARKE